MGGGYYMGGGGSAASDHPALAHAGGAGFATLVGLFCAGILPANKAVKISALEAIRHE